MLDKIILAQLDDPILQNLNQTDQQVNELNNQVNNLLSDYSQQGRFASFFNFDNPFFLLTLFGLVLLAIGLLSLYVEIKKPSKHKQKTQATENHKESKPKPAEKKQIEASQKKKPVKIKVVKVK